MHHHNHHPPPYTTATNQIRRPFIVLGTTIFTLLLVLILTTSHTPPSPPPQPPHPSLFPSRPHRLLILHHASTPPAPPPPSPPSLAYFITASANQTTHILRLLFSIYHPKNHYLLHLDSSAPQSDRESLALTVQSAPLFRAAQNVYVIGKADAVDPRGSSTISVTLHGAAVLLRVAKNWDWFINLSVQHYPLVTQDDLLHILSYLPNDLNFVNHTSYIGWRESRRIKPIIVDPSLYLKEHSEMFYATQKRELPDAFRLFTGASSGILSRKFIEFSILGTDNLARTLLMYLSNTASADSVYFPTVLCNSRQFNRTTINHNFQYAPFGSIREPQPLNSSSFNDLVGSGAAFASSLLPNDPILDRIDQEILQRSPGKPVPGGWCLGESGKDRCNLWGDADVLRPGPGAKRLERQLVELLSNGTLDSRQCIWE